MNNKQKEPPPGWGEDHLTKYLDSIRNNQFATFHNQQNFVAKLIRIDNVFHKLLNGAINLRPSWPALFMHRAQSAFRSASGAAMSGQCYEIHALLRMCLEQAGYGLYINGDNDRFETWLRRHDDVSSFQKMRGEFTPTKIENHIRSIAPILADHFHALYQHTIDHGAHPNERGLLGNLTITKANDNRQFETIMLHDESHHIIKALDDTSQVGLWLLIAAQLIWKERFELLGQRQEIDALKRVIVLPS